MAVGVASLAAAAAAAAVLVETGAPRAWRIAVLPPLWLGLLALLEARAHTCVVLAARGTRNMDDGTERVADSGERRQLWAQAARVHVIAAAGAAALGALLAAL